ncbi:Gfo/Idh/MocA family oxidoreductase [Paenibacillus sp.]|uniref:Gfo/Idh/MocA family protein n=1 Tax=Paenibacillus sp. TaxID=58172 RepID=UPI002D4172AD|nr:Gfo/Idh/MocA family oxidoreductase [Paenibacillus sp.]HZG56987.1 Gfo/Idh/MocA family oxidoreductase [Paenibacillus sp.]
MEGKIRWGILGCAGIAERAVIPGIRGSETGVVSAIASRTESKAKETAERLDIPKAYSSYEALLEDDEIDAVYIPLPNHLHCEWTVRAAEAGKHVLCEKPIALDAAEAERMANACADAGVLFAEAFMYRLHPRYDKIREMIAAGDIGELRGIHGAFTFNGAANKGNVRFVKEWGGGSIYDVGVYPISAARLVTGLEPEAATCRALFSAEHGDVDMMASGLVEFPNDVSLTFDCGMWAEFRNTLEILGTAGRIEVPHAFIGPQQIVVHKKGERTELEMPTLNTYSLQADAFGRAVRGEASLPFSPQDAVNNMRVVDACLKSARERTRVVL